MRSVRFLQRLGAARRHASSKRDFLRFSVNGKETVLRDAEPDQFLIQHLRNSGLVGTKLTCGEGGCGACTVLLSHRNSAGELEHRSVNSCLVPLCAVDGMQVTTVEGLGTSDNMHPVQERMAVYGGSQCGGCTPGFVMSIFSTLQSNPDATTKEMLKSIDGNLCRCTGYRPIVEVARSFCSDHTTKQNELSPLTGIECAPFDASKHRIEAKLPSDDGATLHIDNRKRGMRWITPRTMDELLQLKRDYPNAKIVAGNTELGIELRYKAIEPELLISPQHVAELHRFDANAHGVEFGASLSLSALGEKLEHLSRSVAAHQQRSIRAITEQLHWFSGTPIRNVATVGGNIANASPISDLNPVWMALDASFVLRSANSGERVVNASQFFGPKYKQIAARADEVLVGVRFAFADANRFVESYKQSKRREDDIAIVTASLAASTAAHAGGVRLSNVVLAYGGMAPCTIRAARTEQLLQSANLDRALLSAARHSLMNEIGLRGELVPGGMSEYRTVLAASFLHKFLLGVIVQSGADRVAAEELSALQKLYEPMPPQWSHSFQHTRRGIDQPHDASVGESEPHVNSRRQATGEAQFVDDATPRKGQLFACLVTSAHAHATIESIDASEALRLDGVRAVLTHKDVPGSNKWGDIVDDEELFASERVLHYGQPIGVVVADTEHAAKRAAALVNVKYGELHEPVLSIDEAIRTNSFYANTPTLAQGNPDEAFNSSENVVASGVVRMGGQEHFYFEPHSAIVVPDDGDFTVYSSTQNANKTQKWVAAALGLPMSRVVTRVGRIGGGFGGKESRNICFAMAAAVAAAHTKAPVRLVLERPLDMQISGTRHPFRAEYRIAASRDGKLKAGMFELISNGGFSLDLSGPVLERAVLFCDGCYNFPAIRTRGRIAKTNLPSNTAFRGFGGPQGMFAAEAAMEHLAAKLNIEDPSQLREANLYNDGDLTYYGHVVTKNVRASFEQCKRESSYDQRRAEIAQFNAQNSHRKRGICLMPAKYGIAFTFFALNQGGALVHVYTDGTVLVSHGGIEMGQGLNTKVAQAVATELRVPLSHVHIREMATDKVPNAPPTAASLGSDTYVFAALEAARKINSRLQPLREAEPSATLHDLALKAFLQRIELTAQGFFRSEHKGFDWTTGKGEPWRYFTLGTACSEVEIDCLTGDFKLLRSDLVVDIGKSINPAIDIGQIEGAFVQGAGLWTIEEHVIGDEQHKWIKPGGRNATIGPGAYKIPSSDDIPLQWNISVMKDSPLPERETIAVHSSKAVGEPPLLLGMSVPFAIKDAIAAHRRSRGLEGFVSLDFPLTAERIRMACVDEMVRATVPDAEHFRAKGSW